MLTVEGLGCRRRKTTSSSRGSKGLRCCEGLNLDRFDGSTPSVRLSCRFSLSFKGMMELHNNLQKRFKFTLFERPDELERVAVLVEKRNLVEHNRGVVN